MSTVLEEMPVQETADTVGDLDDAGIPVGAVVVNQVRRPLLTVRDLAAARQGRLDRLMIEAGLRVAGLTQGESLVDRLAAEAAAHAERVALEKRERTAVAALDRPTYELPWLPDGIDLAGLYELGAALSDQGAA